ncbi:MAG: AglZ/HisF2 family acetamidino modification protein [Nevskiales bacterium]
MSEPRVLPCLLLMDGGLHKTVRFRKPNYVGDPVNVISIFNQFEVDEIVLLDITASLEQRGPAFESLARVANECMIPLAYGGGIRSVADIERIFKIGAEKVVLNSALAGNHDLIRAGADRFGSQAIVVSVDARPRRFGRKGYVAMSHHATRVLAENAIEYAQKVEQAGAGEILLNAVHRDGMMEGYDLDLIRQVVRAVRIPVIACGGAGDKTDLYQPILQAHASAAAAGSIFVYQNRERGVLINFPERGEIEMALELN